MQNLNHSVIDSDSNFPDIPTSFQDYGVTASSKVTVHFRNLESKLLQYIQQSSCVIGCVAWLTNQNILKAMSNLQFVSLIVQKEDFLRPDISNKPNWTSKLRDLYSSLPSSGARFAFPGIVGSLSVCYDPTLESESLDWSHSWMAPEWRIGT